MCSSYVDVYTSIDLKERDRQKSCNKINRVVVEWNRFSSQVLSANAIES